MIALLLATVLAFAQAGNELEPPPPLWTGEGSPWTVGHHHGAGGLFAPLRVGFGDRVELRTPGTLTLLSPGLQGKFTIAKSDKFAFAATAQFAVPQPGITLAQGWFYPSNRSTGFAAIMGAGIRGGVRLSTVVISLGAEFRVGAKSDTFSLEPSDMVFLDTLMAPLTEGPQGTLRLVVDYFPGLNPYYFDSFGITFEARGHVGGLGPDADARLFLAYRAGRHVVIGFGVVSGYERLTTGYHLSVAPLLDMQFRW